MQHVYVGAMVGKLTKMCQGLSVTHAWKAEIDRDCSPNRAGSRRAGRSGRRNPRRRNRPLRCRTSGRTLGLTVAFHRALAGKAIRSLKTCYPGNYHLSILVCDFEGQFICRLEEDEIL
jgi:cobalt-precorrin-5B (C1)-methyltransferase